MSEQDDVMLDTSNEPSEEDVKTDEVEETEAYSGTEDTSATAEEEKSSEDVAKLKELNKKLFERAKKAEAELKKLKAEVKKVPSAQLDPDELRLIARGLSDEEIEQAKVIAKGRGVSLSEALKDPLFEAFRKDFEERQKREKAQLGASKGSSQVEEQPLVKPGMTTEEHKKVWAKMVGR